MKIQDRLLLSTLTLGAWGGAKLHRRETAEVNAKHGVTDVAKVRVTLTTHPALASLRKLHAEIRDSHRALTLPSADDGFRLIPAAKQIDLAGVINASREKHEALAAEYCAAYPSDQEAASIRMNGMYDPRHWPSPERLAASFKFCHKFLPVPEGGAWDEWAAESTGAAEEELRTRLTDALSAIQRNCSGDGRLYESLLTNLREVIDLVPHFALPRLSSAVEADRLARQNIETLRESTQARRDAAQEAARLLSIFGGNAQ